MPRGGGNGRREKSISYVKKRNKKNRDKNKKNTKNRKNSRKNKKKNNKGCKKEKKTNANDAETRSLDEAAAFGWRRRSSRKWRLIYLGHHLPLPWRQWNKNQEKRKTRIEL